jgi:hypothetical protein
MRGTGFDTWRLETVSGWLGVGGKWQVREQGSGGGRAATVSRQKRGMPGAHVARHPPVSHPAAASRPRARYWIGVPTGAGPVCGIVTAAAVFWKIVPPWFVPKYRVPVEFGTDGAPVTM